MSEDYEENTTETTTRARKIYCANCENCKLVRVPAEDGQQYQLRVRCASGKWLKKNGEDKLHKYFTLSRRTLDYCDSYAPMGDPKEFLKEFKSNLPTKDEVYS